MRPRFGRGRKTRSSRSSKETAIDAVRCFERVVEQKIVPARSLEPVGLEDIPDHFAALGVGESDTGERLVVGFAPRHGGDAVLAALAYAQRLAIDTGFEGAVAALCPQWTIAARRRLGLIGDTPFAFRALAAPTLADGDNAIEREAAEREICNPARWVAESVDNAAQRDLFSRALAALEGLAAKHGGAVRGVAARVELVVMSRRVAVLSAENDGVVLESILPSKSIARLDNDQLATAMDRLEGNLRKRLNDRQVRGGEEGLRARLAPLIAETHEIRHPRLWPLPGSDSEVLDLVGLNGEGRPVVVAVRSELTVAELGAILDGVAALQPSCPALFAEAGARIRPGAVRLILAAKQFDSVAVRLLSLLALEYQTYDIQMRRGRDPILVPREVDGVGMSAEFSERPQAPAAPAAPAEEGRPKEEEPAREPRRSTGRGRRPRRGRSSREPREADEPRAAQAPSGERDSSETEASELQFDEVSLFDLDEGATPTAEKAAPRRPRRGRRRGRRGRSSRGGAASNDDEVAAEPGLNDTSQAEEASEPDSPARRRERRRETPASEDSTVEDDGDDGVDDLADSLIPAVAEIEEPDLLEEPAYDEDLDPSKSGVDAETRALADIADAESTAIESENWLRRPRRRVAIVAHADRGSVIAALMLARDLRLLEGIWVYPQTDLMRFFRSVATDLRDETPIYVVGFTATPARDTIQAAALYSGRLAWFDHHDWPPEDLEKLRDKVGADYVKVTPGTESPLLAVLAERTRRSRFSDKIIELATGRFSEHDFERWGRLWWNRLAEIAERGGECRASLEPLLVGRPSDLAVEAAAAPVPPVPPEVEFVAGRDFRLVHFGGYRLVVVPTPADFDLHLVGRVARERYMAEISISFQLEEELLILGSEEGAGNRGANLAAIASHLASKHDWITALPADDHIGRVRIEEFAANPERLDEVIVEIAMGRSILDA